jgi:hypothetical protein
MSYLIVVGVIFGALFLAAYITRRRLGVLGLALAAGSILASLWVNEVTPLVASAGVEIIKPPLGSLVETVLILLPAALLFFNGMTVKEKLLRLISALVFALLAIAFLLEPLDTALVIDSASRPVHNILVEYKSYIITIGLALSVLDMMFSKKLGHHERHARH